MFVCCCEMFELLGCGFVVLLQCLFECVEVQCDVLEWSFGCEGCCKIEFGIERLNVFECMFVQFDFKCILECGFSIIRDFEGCVVWDIDVL